MILKKNIKCWAVYRGARLYVKRLLLRRVDVAHGRLVRLARNVEFAGALVFVPGFVVFLHIKVGGANTRSLSLTRMFLTGFPTPFIFAPAAERCAWTGERPGVPEILEPTHLSHSSLPPLERAVRRIIKKEYRFVNFFYLNLI